MLYTGQQSRSTPSGTPHRTRNGLTEARRLNNRQGEQNHRDGYSPSPRKLAENRRRGKLRGNTITIVLCIQCIPGVLAGYLCRQGVQGGGHVRALIVGSGFDPGGPTWSEAWRLEPRRSPYSLDMGLLKIRVRPLAVLAMAAVLVSALGGCGGGGGSAADGPLGSRVDGRIPRGSNCVPGGHAQAFGDQQFTNHGHATVVLDRVVLLHPRNERLIGSYAVPGQWVIGVVFWPPRYRHMPPTWKDRQPVHGFQLAPGKSFNMVLGLIAAAPGQASSRGMLVYYGDSAGSYVARNYFAMIIAATKGGC